ncbi:hypothetical protein C0992_011552, partial [Termitomyces sp. T32_za158]
MDLARQERQWAEAAAQSAAIMSAEQEAELLEERRVALAALLAKRTAEAQAAGFLEVGEAGAATGGEAVEMGEAAAGSAAATVEPAEEFEAPETDNGADNEDEVPATPKRVPTAGGSGRSPAVIKRASKSTTPSKRRTQKAVPQYEPSTATTFTDAQLRNLLVPRRDEVVLDDDRCAGENRGRDRVTNVGPTTTPSAAGTQLVPSPVTVAMPSKGLAPFLVRSLANAA